MQFTRLEIPDLILIEPRVFGDERGFFMETFQAERFSVAGLPVNFAQDNHSRSRCGVLRGLHYQVWQPQGKLLRVIQGEIYDVAVDLRRSSPSFGRWLGVQLSAENKRQLWVPPGFAHGFLVLSENAEVLYKTTTLWAPAAERTLRWNDTQLAIDWPFPAGVEPILAAKDQQGHALADFLAGEDQIDPIYH